MQNFTSNPLSVLTYAASQGYDPWLISDDNGHWTVCDSGMSTVDREPEFQFSGIIEPTAWHDTPQQALIAYAIAEGWQA